jgi:hypothetical protein
MGKRLLAVAGEVTRHGRAHPYSWSITIVSLRSKESEESHRSEWKTKLLGMLLAVTCQHASGACQSHSCPVLNLREASRKYVELSPTSVDPIIDLLSLIVSRTFKLISIHLIVSVIINKPIGASPRRNYVVTRMVLVRIG